jgi:two-component system, NarL family, nitrate/nitrite response regulator NarL
VTSRQPRGAAETTIRRRESEPGTTTGHTADNVGTPAVNSPKVVFMAASRAASESIALACQERLPLVVNAAFGLSPSDVAAVTQLRPDVVAVDVSDQRALLLVPMIVQQTGAVVLLFGIPDAAEVVVDCVRTGAAGFLGVEATLDELTNAVSAISIGEDVCTSRIAGALVRYMSSAAPGHVSRLSYRELQIADLVAVGMSNKEIARSLNIAVSTVKVHVSNAMRKLRVTRRYEISRALVASGYPRISSRV